MRLHEELQSGPAGKLRFVWVIGQRFPVIPIHHLRSVPRGWVEVSVSMFFERFSCGNNVTCEQGDQERQVEMVENNGTMTIVLHKGRRREKKSRPG